MKTVGVIGRLEDRKVIEIAEPFGVVAAIVPVDQPDVDGHLQDPDRAQGALRDRAQPAPVGGALHHARGRGHGRGRAPRGRARRRDQLDDTRSRSKARRS